MLSGGPSTYEHHRVVLAPQLKADVCGSRCESDSRPLVGRVLLRVGGRGLPAPTHTRRLLSRGARLLGRAVGGGPPHDSARSSRVWSGAASSARVRGRLLRQAILGCHRPLPPLRAPGGFAACARGGDPARACAAPMHRWGGGGAREIPLGGPQRQRLVSTGLAAAGRVSETSGKSGWARSAGVASGGWGTQRRHPARTQGALGSSILG
mmetsp:Transcript_26121/g.84314  ORF Transcript_26121/g.84314 Transcript_26121/m.84314 type:complete len:209 (-) Transcript_26121:806-1432(-)